MSYQDSLGAEPKRGHFATKEGEIVLREHEFDGIQEFDQKLPNWWLFTFYAAIIWFVGYWVFYYHIASGKTNQQVVQEALTIVEKLKQEELTQQVKSLDNGVLVNKWATDPVVVANGQAIFMQNCVPCHGADLSATMTVGNNKISLPGLPLTDHQWKYGNAPMRLFHLINEGTPADNAGTNGARMQAWGQTLAPKQIAELVSFIISKVPEDFTEFQAK
jgi:cytochrome c oxidase cbb3-type subunit 3